MIAWGVGTCQLTGASLFTGDHRRLLQSIANTAHPEAAREGLSRYLALPHVAGRACRGLHGRPWHNHDSEGTKSED